MTSRSSDYNGSPSGNEAQEPKKGAFTRFLDTVEWLGNLLPHPITLFAIFCGVILVASGIAGYFEVSVADPRPKELPAGPSTA
ncbi:AbgT family transporter [Zobellella sp. DQSA1]|uniref:AbgT family transporter n=1 Tax=Zobellella sp. DQSA1 TaxID=3342386 RepID=UPI0035C0C49D